MPKQWNTLPKTQLGIISKRNGSKLKKYMINYNTVKHCREILKIISIQLTYLMQDTFESANLVPPMKFV